MSPHPKFSVYHERKQNTDMSQLFSSGPDAFGGLNGAFLRIRGPLVPAKLKWDNTTSQEDLKVRIKVEQHLDKDYYGGCRVDGLLESVMLRDGRYAVRRRADESAAPEQIFEGVDVYLLPIAVRQLGTFFVSPLGATMQRAWYSADNSRFNSRRRKIILLNMKPTV